ncbi:hypothetical protein [Ramlibacter lithotrophicus]|uniref:hypothetical protein n=1 Tax=Ramlibacter lithotrophicus TaxID=2606681 RepID=UPI00143895B2|nr:hypothetical protein [Ramlibacter lithotrophicus]
MPAFVRIGPGYLRMRRSIAEAGRAGPEASQAALLRRLQALLEHAYGRVPFYREFYDKRGFSPRELRTLDNWDMVPVVTKHDLQEHPIEARTAKGLSGRTANTGGTSGEPLAFLLEKNAMPVEWAHMHAIWTARGYRVNHMKLRFGGTYFPDGEPLRYHPRHNEYIVNANADMQVVVRAVAALPAQRIIRWLHGYPSLVAEFAHALAQLPPVTAARFRQGLAGVLLGSEYPAPMYREPIEQMLSTNIISWYGHSEMALLAHETALGLYRSLPTYGYCEAVPAADGADHRLVCTSMHNRVHPFIRYDTGDRVEPVCASRGSLVFRISEGRIGDFIVDRQQRRLALTSIIFGRHHAAFDEVRHLQVRQDCAGRATLLVVPRVAVRDAGGLLRGFDFSGLDVDWCVELIPAPVRTRSGKIRLKVEP